MYDDDVFRKNRTNISCKGECHIDILAESTSRKQTVTNIIKIRERVQLQVNLAHRNNAVCDLLFMYNIYSFLLGGIIGHGNVVYEIWIVVQKWPLSLS